MNSGWHYFKAMLKWLFDRISNETIKTNILHALPFWFASLLTGLIAVGYARLFSFAEQMPHFLVHHYSWTFFLVLPAAFLLAWFIVQRWSPFARGSGIPQVMAALEMANPRNKHLLNNLLGIRIICTKIISSLIMVMGGAAVGREGPTIQIAGSVFHVVHRLLPKSWPRLSHQSFILTGAAAGLAAAFNTPLGGIVFAMEELAKIHVKYFRTALFSTVIFAGLTAQALLGPYLYLGYPVIEGLKFSIFIGVIGTAIIAGLLGSAMCEVILRIMQWRKRLHQPAGVIAFIIASGLLMATMAYFTHGANLGSGKELMQELLFTDQKSSPITTVLWRFAGPVLSFCVGGAGGVFAPALAGGAAVGAWLSGVFHVAGANANILMLCGMVSFLTGVTRTPFTSAILVLEMTDRHSIIFHLMLAAMIANLAAMLVSRHSFYDQLKKGFHQEVQAQQIAGNKQISDQPTPS